ncbi:hypothetical protein B9Q13_01475 [Candidatus Marsarchaeota G2 archaeon ECH_B_SAG-G16]|uniref:DDE domain-containing protein n=1 Tax=Candidatus Marsarchaeota G2 archaeon ECH_B_SAG-G16 TaxID=1978167 RepID=A0A2R6C419_9ARCH|nr:MAG: hypothetical protein B9Q13_01475 [Candidatus Marsarchaeota G2 archaeon ECH_B_SAG-G16]
MASSGCSLNPSLIVQDWAKKVEAKLSFKATPSWHFIIAVDESVVKCGGRAIYVWVEVDACTRQPVWFGVSLTRTMENALRFLRRLRRRCLGDPVHG